MQLDDTKLTSVRVIPDLYDKFKVEGSKYKILCKWWISNDRCYVGRVFEKCTRVGY
jgi:hypothetical protein